MAERRLNVRITGDAKDLNRMFGDAEQFSERFGRTLGDFGKKGALALAGVAAASTKLASDFEASMSKMVGLVGLSQQEVDGFKESILALAGDTAQAPQELADAMFFITSAGLRGSAALETLEASAQAAAAGLGATQDVAFAAVSAVNAYGEANLSATDAVDILTNTVRQGNVEAADVAGVLGNVIPVASELGVSFDQVGASIAAMTRLGADAASSATSLNAIMSTLIKPTVQAEEALAGVGLSAAELRTQLSEEGLMAVLFRLRDAFVGNDEAIAQVFGNVRALRGVMNLAGENADTTRQIFDSLADSTGTLGEAFSAVADDDGFKLKQSLTDIKAELTATGEDILPKLASALSDNREAIGDTVGGIGDMAVSLVDLAVAAEPVLQFLPDIADGLGFVTNSAVNVGAGLAAVTAEILTFGQANTEALQATADNAAAQNDLKNAVRNLEAGLVPGASAATQYANVMADLARKGTLTETAIQRLASASGAIAEEQAAALQTMIDYARENELGAEAVQLLREQLGELRIELDPTARDQAELARMMRLAGEDADDLTDALDDTSDATSQAGDAFSQAGGDAAEAARKLREDFVAAAETATASFAEIPEKLDITVAEIEENLGVIAERNERFFTAVRTLAEAGLTDLAQTLITQGPAAVDQAESLVGNMEEAFNLEQLIDDLSVDAERLPEAAADGVERGMATAVGRMQQFGIDLRRAFEFGFGTPETSGLTLDQLVDQSGERAAAAALADFEARRID